MARPRKNNITIDEEIIKQEEQVSKSKAKYDADVKKLKDLYAKKDEMKKRELLEAVEKSSKTFEEIIAETSDVGIYNTYKSDRIRPYLPTDADNPTWDYKHIARQLDISIDNYSFYSEDIKTYITDDFSIRPNGMMKTDKMTGANMFYADGYNLLTPKIKYKDKFMSKVNMDVMLLCLLSISLYQGQLPVIRDGETDNNRPLYEPWTLYLYEYLVNRYIFDIDNEYPVPVFDLSPSWG